MQMGTAKNKNKENNSAVIFCALSFLFFINFDIIITIVIIATLES